jgi:hypothetical protein
MTRIVCLVALLTACDFGIGSDPDPHPAQMVCAPGHARTSTDAPCVTTLAPVISIDGGANDWAGVPDFEITGGRLALASNDDEDSDLLVRAIFTGGPLDTVVLELAPSPVRPASGGSDRMTVDASGIRYEKNDLVVTPSQPELQFAATPDGFEAAVLERWLTYQGALRMRIVGSRGGTEVLRGEAIDVCFGFRAGDSPLPAQACEVAQ